MNLGHQATHPREAEVAATLPMAAARRMAAIAILGAALFAAGCQDWPFRIAGGGGTEAENGEVIAGRIYLPDGKAASGAKVFLRRGEYVRDTAGLEGRTESASAIADRDGGFAIDSVRPGAYMLEIRNGAGLAGQIQFEVGKESGTLELSPDTLHPPGILKGMVELIPGSPSPAYIQVYGLNRVARADANGSFTIADLPSGYLRIQAVSSAPGWSYEGPSVALLSPAGTAYLPTFRAIASDSEDFASWPHARNIRLRTDASGIAGTVTDAPILVRLDTGNFDFTESDGKDIRFADAAGKRLAYQIDQWEPARGFAALWIRLDSVVGTGGNPSVTIYWGKRNAPDFSSGKSVFASFAGVWHLGEALNGLGDGSFRDASPSAVNGLAGNLIPDHRGLAGDGAGFNGGSSISITAGKALQPTQALTLSAWINLASVGQWGAQLVSMGNNYLLWIAPDGNANFSIYTDSTWDPNHDPAANPWNVCSTIGIDLRNAGWHQVTSTYDGINMRIFVDGMEKASRSIGKPIAYIFGQEFVIGASVPNPTDDSPHWKFLGSLDEIRVSAVARSPAWIKLEYETEKPGSDFLEFR